ncbi:hypothetical protein IWZ01DRAFT_573254 [Phyllosticta capitalensis]
MGIGAPSFGSREYWDCRFSRDPTAFDWLVPATRLDRHIRAVIRAFPSDDPFPRIHHIGCGTSALSFQLRRLVLRPSQVLNSDYSRAAVEIGRTREEELFGTGAAGVVGEGEQDQVRHRDQGVGVSPESESEAPSMPRESMRWRTLDLLSAPAMAEVAAAAGLGAVALVVDKSTSDCIACVDDVAVTLPYLLQPSPSPPTPAAEPPPPTTTITSSAKIHPLHVLAVNLAATTAPGGRWLCVSYSGARFPFLDPQPTRADEGALRGDVLAAGFVHPGRLWRLEACERIEADDDEEDGDADEDEDDDKGRDRGGAGVAVVHRPRIAHHLYVLVRTELRLQHVVADDGSSGGGGI